MFKSGQTVGDSPASVLPGSQGFDQSSAERQQGAVNIDAVPLYFVDVTKNTKVCCCPWNYGRNYDIVWNLGANKIPIHKTNDKLCEFVAFHCQVLSHHQNPRICWSLRPMIGRKRRSLLGWDDCALKHAKQSIVNKPKRNCNLKANISFNISS